MKNLLLVMIKVVIVLASLPMIAMDSVLFVGEKLDAVNVLIAAIQNNNKPGVKAALLKDVSCINNQDKAGDTPLHVAIKQKEPNSEIIQLLVDNKVFIGKRNKNNHMPLFYLSPNAQEGTKLKIIECMAQAFADETREHEAEIKKKYPEIKKELPDYDFDTYCYPGFYEIFTKDIMFLIAMRYSGLSIEMLDIVKKGYIEIDDKTFKQQIDHYFDLIKLMSFYGKNELGRELKIKKLSIDQAKKRAVSAGGDIFFNQLKDIVENPKNHYDEIAQRIADFKKWDHIYVRNMREVMNLLGYKESNTTYFMPYAMYQEWPDSAISYKQFSLAFTTFARVRRGLFS